MLDAYSKVIFSVIAAALVVIAWNGIGNGRAIAGLGDGCGSMRYNPCYVTTTDTVRVHVANPVEVTR